MARPRPRRIHGGKMSRQKVGRFHILTADVTKNLPCRVGVSFESHPMESQKSHRLVPLLAGDSRIGCRLVFIHPQKFLADDPGYHRGLSHLATGARNLAEFQRMQCVGSLRKNAQQIHIRFGIDGRDTNRRSIKNGQQAHRPMPVPHRRAKMIEQGINVLADPHRADPVHAFSRLPGIHRGLQFVQAHHGLRSPPRLAAEHGHLAHVRLARGVCRIEREEKADEDRNNRGAGKGADKHHGERFKARGSDHAERAHA